MIAFLIASLAVTNVLASFGTIQPAQYAVDDLHVDFSDFVDITSAQWYLNIDSGDEVEEWDIQLDMTGDFQFDSSSYINVADFQVNGECQFDEWGRCDLFFGFGVGSKYFTMLVDFDGSAFTGIHSDVAYGMQIYPACGGSLASGSVSDLLAGSSSLPLNTGHQQRQALSGGSYVNATHTNWEQMGGSRHNNGETWPVTIEIKNNVATKETTVRFMSATQDLSCVYSDTFDQDTDTVFGMVTDSGVGGNEVKILSVTIAEENVDICEGMCDASSAYMHFAHQDPSVNTRGAAAAYQGPAVNTRGQVPSAGIGGFEDVDSEPFSLVLSTKDLVVAVLAFMTVILMVIICVLKRKGGVGMSRQYKVVSVVGDSEMEEMQK